MTIVLGYAFGLLSQRSASGALNEKARHMAGRFVGVSF